MIFGNQIEEIFNFTILNGLIPSGLLLLRVSLPLLSEMNSRQCSLLVEHLGKATGESALLKILLSRLPCELLEVLARFNGVLPLILRHVAITFGGKLFLHGKERLGYPRRRRAHVFLDSHVGEGFSGLQNRACKLVLCRSRDVPYARLLIPRINAADADTPGPRIVLLDTDHALASLFEFQKVATASSYRFPFRGVPNSTNLY